MMQSSFRTMLSLTTTKIVVNRTMIISTCNIRCLSSLLGNTAPVTAIAVTPITPPARRSVATALPSSVSSSSSSSTPLSIKIVNKRTIFSAAANANANAAAIANANAAAGGSDSSTKPPLVPVPVVRVVTIEVMPGCYNEFHKWRTELDAIMTKLDLHGVKVEHFESKRTTNILDSTSTVDDDDDDNYDKDKHRSVMFQSRSASVAVLLGDDNDNDNDDNDNNDHKIYDTIITTFPSKKELNRWEESEERTEWLNRGNGKLLQM